MVLILILLIAIAFVGTQFMMKRATRSVIRIFRENDALSPDKAMTIQDLRLAPRGLFQVKAFRDYKPTALQFLMKNDIVVITDDGRVYLSEESLMRSELEQRLGRQR
jgi:hypothetical protein